MMSHLSTDKGGNIDDDCQTSSFDNNKKMSKWETTVVDGRLRQTKCQMGDNNNNKSIAKISSLVINCQFGHFEVFATCHIFM
jgi:hypothetical protein